MTVTNDKLYADGLQVRREVLGPAWVDPQMEKAKSDDFTAAIQDMVTEYCWGYGWARGKDVLDRKTRSIMNLCILTALGKMNELKGHVRGAMQNGCTEEEIKEALIHATIYCGIPAGVDAFRNAKEAIDAYKSQ